MSIVGSVCEWNEFECGDDKYECVSELLACDGVKDCTNGGDEDPGFCDSESYVYRLFSHKTASCVKRR